MMKVFDHLEGLIWDKLNRFILSLEMVKLEAKLASLTIGPLLLTIGLLLIVGLSTWLIILTLMVYFFIWLFSNIFLGLLCVLLINIILGTILLFYLLSLWKNVSFQKSRQLMQVKEVNK